MMVARCAAICAAFLLAACGATPTGSGGGGLPAGAQVTVTEVAARGIRVPVTLVAPAAAAGERVPLVLLVHGHGGTRDEAGAFVSVAAQLAAEGIASVRMDFAGCGDSNEPFSNNNLTTMLADIRAAEGYALQTIAVDTERLALVGYSMGGRLAAMRTAQQPVYKSMVVWAGSLSNGAERLQSIFGGAERYEQQKTKAQTVGVVDYTTPWGQQQQLGLQWFTDLESSRPLDAIAQYTGALLLIHGDEDDVVLPAVSTLALNAATRAEISEVAMIDGADHGFGLYSDEPELTRQLIDQTVSFLVSTL